MFEFVSVNWNCGLTLFLPWVDAFIAFAVIPKVTIENHRCKRRIKKKMNKICQYKCCILRVRSIGKSGFRFSKSKSGFPNRTRNPKTDFTSEKPVLRVDFNPDFMDFFFTVRLGNPKLFSLTVVFFLLSMRARARPLFLRTVFQILFRISQQISQRWNPFSDFTFDCKSETRILKSKSRFTNRTHP